ncbi:MAG: hypothetical protein Q9217_004699 [Psora testacea]
MSTKRKFGPAAANAAVDEVDAPASKRRKLPDSGEETAEHTTQTGFDLLDQLKKSRDKHGWAIATHFLTLPDRDALPQYYKEIGLPIALDTIEGKLERKEYPNITALESDVKRMISNAKSFNVKTSQIYSDVEKVRKLVSNFMTERNPAYRNQAYQAVPTPLPEGWEKRSDRGESASKQEINGDVKAEEPLSDSRNGRRSRRHATQTPAAETGSRRASSTPVIQDAEGAGESFEGNTFQQAQDKIVTEMMNLTNNDNQFVSANFIHLPSRTLQDYYRLIKHPVSLKGLQKLVRGIKGHAPPAGTTLLKSWHAFEQEASYIWNNARDYNEDTSTIVELANELKAYFHRRLKEAKAVVNEPPQPRVKLTMGGKSPEPPPKITLKFGSSKSKGQAGVSVDNESLKRQQDLVRAGVNGQGSSTSKASYDRPGSGSDNGIIANGIKREASHVESPALGANQMNGSPNSTMPPPMHLSSAVHSGSPHPQTAGGNGAPSAAHYPCSASVSHLRQPDASDALITSLNITTHPDSNLPQRFNLDITASNTRTLQSVTVALPNSYSYLRIAPTLSSTLMQRPSKTFVTCNNRRQQALPQRELDQIRPLYEHVLSPGVNTIEVEVIAGLPRGAPKSGLGSDIEIEKITLFIHLQGP